MLTPEQIKLAEKAARGEYSEQDVRYQRDRVFGWPISDDEWDKCKSNWMKPTEIDWLFSQPTES